MPSLCNFFLLCATALENTEKRQTKGSQDAVTQVQYFNKLIKLINLSLAALMEVTATDIQTQDTHTFPMYRLGQTSSTGVSSSVQESKMSSSSLMSTRSCSWLLPDILLGHRVLPQQTVCVHCPFSTRVCSSVRDDSRWLFEWSMPPKLALCVQ